MKETFMKLTKQQLKQIIKEELLKEAAPDPEHKKRIINWQKEVFAEVSVPYRDAKKQFLKGVQKIGYALGKYQFSEQEVLAFWDKLEKQESVKIGFRIPSGAKDVFLMGYQDGMTGFSV